MYRNINNMYYFNRPNYGHAYGNPYGLNFSRTYPRVVVYSPYNFAVGDNTQASNLKATPEEIEAAKLRILESRESRNSDDIFDDPLPKELQNVSDHEAKKHILRQARNKFVEGPNDEVNNLLAHYQASKKGEPNMYDLEKVLLGSRIKQARKR